MPENSGRVQVLPNCPISSHRRAEEIGKPKTSAGGRKALLASSSVDNDEEDTPATKPAKNVAAVAGKATGERRGRLRRRVPRHGSRRRQGKMGWGREDDGSREIGLGLNLFWVSGAGMNVQLFVIAAGGLFLLVRVKQAVRVPCTGIQTTVV